MSSRRDFLKVAAGTGLAAGLVQSAHARPFAPAPLPKPEGAFRVFHLTDMHIRPEFQAEARCTRLLQKALADTGPIDLALNGGDSIFAADYGHITRERVLEQWDIWDNTVMSHFQDVEMVSALGNHDMWWVPENTDPMYGKDYVLERLGQTNRYFSVERGGWLIITLDCNNRGLLDEEQLNWLHEEAQRVPDKPILISSHQPVLMAEGVANNGLSDRQRQIITPFIDWSLEARPVYFVSGHIHVMDLYAYANVSFMCNGSFSGAWWNFNLTDNPNIYEGNNSVKGTPMGYATIDLSSDGTLVNRYHDLTDSRDGQLLS